MAVAIVCALPSGAAADAGTVATDVFEFGGSARIGALAAGVALPGGGDALIRNPAALADVARTTVALDYRDWYLDTSGMHAGLSMRAPWGHGAFAASLVRLDEGEVRDLDYVDLEYGAVFDNGSLGVAVGYGQTIPGLDRVDAGVSALFVSRTLLSQTASGVGLGGGLAAGLWGDALRLGGSFRYIGDVSGDIEGISNVSPWNVTGGVSVRIGRFVHPGASATVAADIVKERNFDAGGRAGLEVLLADAISLRVGYDSTVEDAPVRYGVGVRGGPVDVDFVYADHEALGSTTGFSVTLRLESE
jgi:hypothetical protein